MAQPGSMWCVPFPIDLSGAPRRRRAERIERVRVHCKRVSSSFATGRFKRRRRRQCRQLARLNRRDSSIRLIDGSLSKSRRSRRHCRRLRPRLNCSLGRCCVLRTVSSPWCMRDYIRGGKTGPWRARRAGGGRKERERGGGLRCDARCKGEEEDGRGI